MIKKTLKELGLPENEIKVYLALLEIGPSLAGTITKISGVHRANVYGALDRLSEKGLVSFIVQNNRKYFQASEPSRLLGILQDRKNELEIQENKIKEILPDLELKTKFLRVRLGVQVFSGKQGLKTILDDIIKAKPPEWLDITSGKTLEILPYYMDKWNDLRARNKINSRILFNDTPEGRKRERKVKNFKATETRFLPKGFITPSHFYVYKDKVVISVWVEKEPFGIIIEDRSVADSYRKWFDFMWKSSSKK